MKKLIYVEENFISPSECQELIDLSKSNKEEVPYGDESRGGDTFLTHLDGIYPVSYTHLTLPTILLV